jgi:hypothetical protein
MMKLSTIAVTSLSALAIFMAMPTRGAPPENADPALAEWFQSLRQPGTGFSCCSISDCRPVSYRVGQNGYEVLIEEKWRPVPPEKVLSARENPLGRAVVCWTPAMGVMCFVRGTEV